MSLKGMINNYFYGKQGQADYTVQNMPQNRRQLFGEVLKVRWSALVGVNLLYMVAWIPAIIWSFINAAALLASELDISQVSGLASTYLLVMVPLVTITGPFNAGATYVLRNWARDEHSFVLSDFKDAVKANWKQGLAVAFIDGVVPVLVFTGLQFYGGMLSRSPVFALAIGLILMVALIWSLGSMLAFPMLITYDLKLKDVLRNCVLLTVAKLPFAILIKLATLVVPAVAFALIWMIPSIQMHVLMIVVLLYIFFMVAFNKLITTSYANWLCETFINTRIEGAKTDIGLRPKDWDDTQYLPEDDEP